MSGSLLGTRIAEGLLSGDIDSSTLDGYLTTDKAAYMGPWKLLTQSRTFKALLDSPTAFATILGSEEAFGALLENDGAALAASDSATEAIFASAAAAKTVLTTPSYLALWKDVPANYTRLQGRVNQSGSVLIREVFTSSGTWTLPAAGIVALSLTCIGQGGRGGNASYSGPSTYNSGGGGAGGELATKQITTSLPETDVTVTIDGSASSFGAFLSSSPGANGGIGAVGSALGGGTTTNGGAAAMTEAFDPESAPWQAVDASQKGGDGGGGLSNSGFDSNGNSGAVAFAGGDNVAGPGGLGARPSGGQDGEGICSGGGSGAVAYGDFGDNGASASDPGCGGGGGGSGNTNGSFGAGGPGRVIVHAILSEAAA